MRVRCFVLLALIVFSTGCTFRSLRFYPEDMAQIHAGQTTRSEVRKLFGKPALTFDDETGKTIYRYSNHFIELWGDISTAISKSERLEMEVVCLEILFDSNDRVIRHLYFEGASWIRQTLKDEYVMGRWIPKDKGEMVMRRVQRESDLRRIFGPPMLKELDFNGDEVLTWSYVENNGKGDILDIRVLFVLVNEAGWILGYRFIEGVDELEELQQGEDLRTKGNLVMGGEGAGDAFGNDGETSGGAMGIGHETEALSRLNQFEEMVGEF